MQPVIKTQKCRIFLADSQPETGASAAPWFSFLLLFPRAVRYIAQMHSIAVTPAKNRWLMALSAVGVHLPIGSIYAYSVLVLPLHDLHGWSRTQIMTAFSVAILLLGFSAVFLGPRIQRMGPRRSARIAATLYVTGILLAGLGIRAGSFPLFLLGYGAVSGVGLGIGYVTPVATLLQWFPDRKGLATGMAVMGFGLGSLVFGPVMAWMLEVLPIWQTLCLLAMVYGAMMLAASCYLAPPPAGWSPRHSVSRGSGAGIGARAQGSPADEFSLSRALRSRRFVFLWGMLFINICCGISVIAMASPMAQEIAGLSALQAAGLIGVMGFCNGAGRFIWAWLSDHAGRPLVFLSFFVVQAAAFAMLPSISSALVFQGILLLVVSCYGGGFALLPAYLADMFGTHRVVSLFGYALTAWGLAGVAGPWASAALVASSGNYDLVLYIFSGLMLLGAGLAFGLKREVRSEQRR